MKPVEGTSGDPVFAVTIFLSGRIAILVESAGDDTVASNIAQTLNDTQNYKDNLIIRGQKIVERFMPIEFGISAITLAALGPTPVLAVLW